MNKLDITERLAETINSCDNVIANGHMDPEWVRFCCALRLEAIEARDTILELRCRVQRNRNE